MVAIRYSHERSADRPSKSRQPAPGAHHRLLHRVLGVEGRAEHPVAVPGQLAAVFEQPRIELIGRADGDAGHWGPLLRSRCVRSAHHRTATVREPSFARSGRELDTGAGRCESIDDRDDQQPTVGQARLPIDQPAGWVRTPPGTRLDGMTADTLVLPTTTAPATTVPRERGWFQQLGLDTGYVLVSFPVAIAAFVVAVTGISLGIGLLIVWVGVAVLAATLLAARAFATLERAWLPDRPPPPAPPTRVPAARRQPDPAAAHAAARPADVARRAARRRPVPARDLLLRRHGDLLVRRPGRPHLRGVGLGAARRLDRPRQRRPAGAGRPREHGRPPDPAVHRHRRRLRRPAAVRRPRGRPAAGLRRAGDAHLPRGHPGRARPADRGPQRRRRRRGRRAAPAGARHPRRARSSSWSG